MNYDWMTIEISPIPGNNITIRCHNTATMKDIIGYLRDVVRMYDRGVIIKRNINDNEKLNDGDKVTLVGKVR